MGRTVDLDDLLDAADVAALLELSSATSVATYRRRAKGSPDPFPEPVWASKGNRCQAWLRQDVEAWAASHPGRRGQS